MSKLRDIRKSKNISQEQLAVDVGITVRYIAFLESGDRSPSLTIAFKIAKALGVSIEDIFLPSECTKCTDEGLAEDE